MIDSISRGAIEYLSAKSGDQVYLDGTTCRKSDGRFQDLLDTIYVLDQMIAILLDTRLCMLTIDFDPQIK